MTPDEKAAQQAQAAFEAAIKERLIDRARLTLATSQGVVQLLQAAKVNITELLAAQPSDFAQWRLPQLMAQIEAVLAGATANGAAQVDAGLRTAWQQGEDFVDKPLAAAGLNVEAFLPMLDTTVLTQLRSFTTGRIKDVGVESLRKIDASLGLVTIGAKTPFDAIKDIQATLGDEGTRRATTIVRTELGRAFALANEQRVEQAALKVPGLQKQWRRSGKLHSRWNHDAIDGQVVDVGKPFVLPGINGTVMMMHPHDPAAPIEEVINCGCISLPYKKDWRVMTPGSRPFTELETKADARKAQLDQTSRRTTLLPFAANAQIPLSKLTDYALSTEHPDGKNKARVFASVLGFNAGNAHLLDAAIKAALPTARAKYRGKTEWGESYSVPLTITGPGGSGVVTTGWMLHPDSTSPVLTSVYVKPKAK